MDISGFCNTLITFKIHLKSVVVHLSDEGWSNRVWIDYRLRDRHRLLWRGGWD